MLDVRLLEGLLRRVLVVRVLDRLLLVGTERILWTVRMLEILVLLETLLMRLRIAIVLRICLRRRTLTVLEALIVNVDLLLRRMRRRVVVGWRTIVRA